MLSTPMILQAREAASGNTNDQPIEGLQLSDLFSTRQRERTQAEWPRQYHENYVLGQGDIQCWSVDASIRLVTLPLDTIE